MASVFAESPSSYRWPKEGVARVPYWVYSDPAVYELEQEKIFGGASWSFVGLASELPTPGDFKRSYIGDKSIVLTRDKDGINAVLNKCAHRGVQFCQKQFGNAAEFM